MSLLQSKFVWENTLTDEQRLEIALEVAAGLLDDRHVKEDDAEHVKRVITLMIDKFTPPTVTQTATHSRSTSTQTPTKGSASIPRPETTENTLNRGAQNQQQTPSSRQQRSHLTEHGLSSANRALVKANEQASITGRNGSKQWRFDLRNTTASMPTLGTMSPQLVIDMVSETFWIDGTVSIHKDMAGRPLKVSDILRSQHALPRSHDTIVPLFLEFAAANSAAEAITVIRCIEDRFQVVDKSEQWLKRAHQAAKLQAKWAQWAHKDIC